MAEFLIQDSTLSGIADAIRAKEGTTAPVAVSSMAARIGAIEAAAAPTISVSADGLITAEAGSKSAAKQMDTQAAKTVTPGTSDQTAVASGVYTTGAVTVKGDANLKAENIADGVSIFGVAGSHKGGAAIETCEVTIGQATMFKYSATVYENGIITTVPSEPESPSSSPVTIKNVVCGSSVSVASMGLGASVHANKVERILFMAADLDGVVFEAFRVN